MKRLLDWLTRINAFRLALVIGVLFATAHAVSVSRGGGVPIVDRLNLMLYDAKFLLRGSIGATAEEKAKKHVVIAAGDLKTIETLGRWPWDRRIYARIIDNVLADGAKVIAFDMTFADADQSQKDIVEVKKRFDEMKVSEFGGRAAEFALYLGLVSDVDSPDQVLADAVRRGGERVVIGYVTYPLRDPSGPQAKLASRGLTLLAERELFLKGPIHLLERGADGNINTRDRVALELSGEAEAQALAGTLLESSVEPPMVVIADATRRLGYFNAEPDADGVIRSVPMVQFARSRKSADPVEEGAAPEDPDEAKGPFRAGIVGSLSLVTAATALGVSPKQVWANSYGEEFTELAGLVVDRKALGQPDLVIPTSARGSLLVDFHGPDGSFEYVSLADIYEKKFPPGTFKDRIALVGVTAIGTHDQRVTPFDEFGPGVEVHAAAIENILTGRMMSRPAWASGAEFFILLLIAAGLGLLFSRADARISVVVYLAAAIGYFALDFALFKRGMVVTSAIPQLQLLVTFVGTTSLRYLTESREKERVRNTFKFYLDTAVMEQMLTDPSKLTLGGDKKELSVLFSDIRGFTTISEKLPPEQLSALLNEYLTPMTNLVFQNGGTLDKYMGDAVMCFFGAPLTQEDHALRACRTALDMMAELQALQAGWKKRGLPEIDIGVGVNSGPMVVGNFGSAQRGAYTVMGDNVNLASRLEGTNKEYGTHIIISEFTFEPVRGKVAARELGAVKVKGKKLPVKIYELLAIGPMPADQIEFVKAFEEGLRLRHPERRFEEAAVKFRASLQHKPDDLTAHRYLEECLKLSEHPPGEDWDGVYEMKTK